MFELTEALRSDLEAFDTPTVCNALEIVAPKRRGYGYTFEHLLCIRPEVKPLVGIARTARIRSALPPDWPAAESRRISDGYYRYIDQGPKPSIVVIQDVDAQRAYGSFWGEVNSSIHLGLGCRAVVTDGSVRDLPDLAAGFQVLASRIVPSHAFVHVVDFGEDVTVAGMAVCSGDLLHLDRHGAVVIPHDVAHQIKSAALQIQTRERKIIDAARSPGFNAEILHKIESGETDNH